jgi:hypothetical protein
MSAIALTVPHLKVHGFAGDHLLERCEDPGCTVDESGHAGCGRLACPACGFSGSNLREPGGAGADRAARCSCGHAWVPEPVAAVHAAA